MPGTFLKTLELRNFRCFEDVRDFKLDPQLTVVVGKNGAGKTAVLEALRLALGSYFAGMKCDEQRVPGIERTDVRLVSERLKDDRLLVVPKYPVEIRATAQWNGEDVTWRRSLESATGRTKSGRDELELAGSRLRDSLEQESARLPLLCFYGTDRLHKEKRKTERKRRMDVRTFGYLDCLDPASSTGILFEWIERETGLALQAEGKDSRFLAEIERLMCAILGEDVERFRYDFEQAQPVVTWKDGRQLPFEVLSDGYKGLLLLGTDLVRRAAALNPTLQRLSETEGIVIVDEIELHLHVRWQQQILRNLTTAFPNVQFIAASHSPQVLQSVKHTQIRVVTPRGAETPALPTEGRDANALLREVFETDERPANVKRQIDGIYHQLDNGRLDEARRLLSKLRDELGSNDDEVLRAEFLVAQES